MSGWTWRDRGADKWVLEGEQWLHRPRFKVLINTFLRAFQPGRRKWVVVSRCVDLNPDHLRPRALGYGFARVEHRP